MRILLSFLQDKGGKPHNVPSYRFWAYYIKNGIAEAGMSWLEIPGVDWAEGLLYEEGSPQIKSWRDNIWDLTLIYIKNNLKNVDVFLTYLYPKQIDGAAINEIRKLGIPCVNFYCDSIRQFNSVPDKFKVFDLLWVPELEAMNMYKQAKVNCINLPMPMWVEEKHRKGLTPSEEPVISFIGSKDILREEFLSDAINKGLNISIRGNGWIESQPTTLPGAKSIYGTALNQLHFIKAQGIKSFIVKNLQQLNKLKPKPFDKQHIYPLPDFNDYIKITQNSCITLGINRVPTFKRLHTNPLVYSRLRDIEAPMLGACYMTEHCEGLIALYDIGNDIYSYSNLDELLEKSRELLGNKQKRKELRLNGQQKALAEHSVPNSLAKLKKAIFN